MKILYSLLLLAALSLSAIEVGKSLPAPQAAKWYFKPAAPARDKLQGVVLFDVRGADTQEMLRMLETLQKELQLPFTAVAVNVRTATDAFVKATGPYEIGLAADEAGRTRNALAATESLFPYAVLAQAGKVVWSGHPTELESVIGQVRAGKFSLAKQRKVEALRRELQMAIQSGLPQVVRSTAEKILNISPADRIAIQAKVMALESSGRGGEIPEFIRNVCRKNPRDLRLRVMQLDLLLRNGDGAGFSRAVSEFDRDFPAPDAALVHPVAYIIENAPYGVVMPDLALALALRAYESVSGDKDGKSLLRAVACETLARVRAEHGRFAEAAQLQAEAAAIRRGTPLEKAAANRLRYYQALLPK